MPEKTSPNHTSDSPQPTPVRDPSDHDWHWHRSALRDAFQGHTPKSIAEARNFTMECVSRAEALAGVLHVYANNFHQWESENIAFSVIGTCAELMEDLCHFAYGPTMNWWDDEAELVRKGWTAPTEEAKR